MVPDTLRSPNIYRSISEVSNPTATVRFKCQLPGAYPECYGPDQMRTAYGVDQLAPNDGTGKTIVIIDAFGSDALADDLATFDSVWGISDPHLTVTAPFGNDEATSDPDDVFGWAVETSLDVEWAHAIAQGANIVLVVAKSDQDADILAATKYAIDNNLGDVISQSFGEAEQCMDPSILSQQHAAFRKAVQKGITLFASSGDDGAGQPTCDAKPTDDPTPLFKAVSTPATDPNVTGSRRHDPDRRSAARHVPVGDDLERDRRARLSGLGRRRTRASSTTSRCTSSSPSTAASARCLTSRTTPPVIHAVIVVTSTAAPSLVGGTSAGSPQWAAITAIVDQLAKRRSGNINPALYALGAAAEQAEPVPRHR